MMWCSKISSVVHVVFMGIDLCQSLLILILSAKYVGLPHPLPTSWKKTFYLFLVRRACFILNGSANVQAALNTFMQKNGSMHGNTCIKKYLWLWQCLGLNVVGVYDGWRMADVQENILILVSRAQRTKSKACIWKSSRRASSMLNLRSCKCNLVTK